MSRSQQPSKPFRRRNRRLVGSFNALAFAERADKGPEKILPSMPPTSSRSLSENAFSFVLSATSDHREDGRYHFRQFLDGEPKEDFPGRVKPVPLSVNKVADSVRCPSSPNGIVASALRPNTLGSLVVSQNQPKVTLQPLRSLPVATPFGSKLDAPAVRTLRSSQPEPDTSTSHGQKKLPSTTPSQLNLDIPVVSTVNSLRPNPATPTSHDQNRLPLVTPPGSNLDIPAVFTVNPLKPKPNAPTPHAQKRPPSVTLPRPNLAASAASTLHSSRSDADSPPTHGVDSPRTISVADGVSRPAFVATITPRETTVRCAATTNSNRQCLRTVKLPPTHANLDPTPAVYCYQHRSSVTLSPSTAPASPGRDTIRCSGTTKSNRQCLRTVKLPPTHANLDPIPAVYCYQHRNSATSPSSTASVSPVQDTVRCRGTTKSNRQCLRSVKLPATYCYQHRNSATFSSSTASASPGQDTVRCSGTTKSNRQCLRTVKLPPTCANLDPIPAMYCYQHRNSATLSSSTASASSGQDTVRCSGTTKSNRQCLRSVRLPPTHANLDPIPAAYCYQHRNSATSPLFTASASPGQVTVRCSGTTRSNVQCSRSVKLPPTHANLDPIPAAYCYQHRNSATLSPSTAFAPPGQVTVRCGATTKSNKPCSRSVMLPPTHAILDPTPAAYCFQHRNTKETGFYVTGVGCADRYVEFKDYVPEYLRGATQLALKDEMARAPSTSDGPGYIYVVEIRDPSNTRLIQLKVGRTVNIKRRLDQWDKQCGSKEHVLRGWWPGIIEPDSDNGTNGTLLRTQMQPGYPGPLSHRLERLVHIELADLSLYAPYLEPGWPKTNNSEQSFSVAGSLSSVPLAVQETGCCTDCGTVHREIFSFRRPNGGKYKGREWDGIVKPVIEKWGRFIKEYYS